MKRVLLLFIFSQVIGYVFSQNQLPVILQKQLITNKNVITLSFDLKDPDNDQLDVQCKLFSDESASLHQEIMPIGITGDIGYPILAGSNKTIQITLDPLLNVQQIRIVLKVSDRESITMQDLLNQVDTQRLRNTILQIQGRRNNTDKIFYDSCRNILQTALGTQLPVKRLNFVQGGLSATNFESTQYGFEQPAQFTLIDAHYDSFGSSPGADDNASGVAGVLEAQRILAPYCAKKSIRYALFDLEEAGLIGSLIYVSNQISKRESILGVLNFEMIGFYTNEPNTQDLPTGFNILFPEAYNKVIQDNRRGNFITNVANVASSSLKTLFDNNASNHVPGLKVISLEVPGNGSIAPDLRRSDHASFWDKGIPALMLTDGANFRNKKYHTANDSIHQLNFEFMSNVVKATIATAATLSQLEHARCIEIPLTLVTDVSHSDFSKFHIAHLKDQLFIRSHETLKETTVRLVSLEGNVLRTFTNLELSQTGTLINLGTLKHGLYMVQILNGSKQKCSKIYIHED